MILCDTNIFIHLFNGDEETISEIRRIGYENICISSISLMELYRGMRNKNEMARISSRMKLIPVIDVNEDISRQATSYLEEYKLSNDMKIPDALIGATAAVHGVELYT